MGIMNAIDRAIFAVAPLWGAQRMATRRAFAHSEKIQQRIESQYEAGRTDDMRADKWLASQLSVDAGLEQDLPSLRRKSREMMRNDFIGGAIDSKAEHVVGSGFTLQAKIKAKAGVISEEKAKIVNEQLEELFEQVAPTICRTRKRSLWQKMGLVSRCLNTDGECFVVFSDVGAADAPIPLAIEVIDADRVETPPNKAGDPLCRMGVQHGPDKQITGYWIRRSTPGDNLTFDISHDFIPANRCCHLFVEWFAGQSRGLPWMTRILNRAKDGKDIIDAGIIGAEVEACNVAFVKGSGSPINNAIGAATSTKSGQRIEKMQPGRVEYLAENSEVTFNAPKRSNIVGTLIEYTNRTISAGLNWAYEMLMKDWRGVSFAGGRIILHGVKLTTKAEQQLLMDAFLRQLWHRIVDEAVILGLVSIDPRVYSANLFTFRRHTWTPPKWGYSLTPGEEVAAKVMAIDNNLETLADVLAEDQYDFEEVTAQRKIERQVERDFNILPTKVTQVEHPQGNPETNPQHEKAVAV